jgi:hypothetical protein
MAKEYIMIIERKSQRSQLKLLYRVSQYFYLKQEENYVLIENRLSIKKKKIGDEQYI